MAKLLLNFRGVPDDEIDEIRELLNRNEIQTYETAPSRWGISAGAIWLADDEQHKKASMLLDEYQSQRSSQARADYLRRRAEGSNVTLLDKIVEDPVRFVLYLAAIGLILYFSVQPFIDLGK